MNKNERLDQDCVFCGELTNKYLLGKPVCGSCIDKLDAMSRPKTSIESISLVQRVDSWAQENDSYLDKQFSRLYVGEEGWEGVAKNYPSAFARALALAMENEHRLEGGNR